MSICKEHIVLSSRSRLTAHEDIWNYKVCHHQPSAPDRAVIELQVVRVIASEEANEKEREAAKQFRDQKDRVMNEL